MDQAEAVFGIPLMKTGLGIARAPRRELDRSYSDKLVAWRGNRALVGSILSILEEGEPERIDDPSNYPYPTVEPTNRQIDIT